MKENWKKYLKVFIIILIIYSVLFEFNNVIQKPILNILFAIYGIIGDFGVAIILLTLLVRVIIWPLVSKQFIQQRKMKEIQPELAEIKRKTKGNKMLEATMMQELYKEKEINPSGSMLTLLIQMPIFIAIFGIIRCFSGVTQYTPEVPAQLIEYKAIVAVENYEKGSNLEAETKFAELEKIKNDHAYLVDSTYSFTMNIPRVTETISDPSSFKPKLFGILDLTKHATEDWLIMILAIAAAVFQYIQTAQTLSKDKNKQTLKGLFKEAASGKEMSQAEIMQKSMGSTTKLFPILTFIVAINFPGALVLYYAVTSLAAIVQQKIILGVLAKDLDEIADKKGAKIKEAEVVKDNTKKTKNGTKIKHITIFKKGGKK